MSNLNENATGEEPSDNGVLGISSTILNQDKLNSLISAANILRPRNVLFTPCKSSDRVSDSRTEEEVDFFYAYQGLFSRSGLQLPFTDFQMKILKEIKAAPAQLHPNSWCFVRSFELLCQSLALTPAVSAFFYFFQLVGHGNKDEITWVKLHARHTRKNRPKILIFDESSKNRNFKDCFFRVERSDGTTPFFMDENRKPKFPLYWSNSVRSPDSPDLLCLSDSELTLIDELKNLEKPRRCIDLIHSSGSKRNTKADLREPGHEGSDEEEDEESEEEAEKGPLKMETKRKVIITRAAKEHMKKQKVSLENNPGFPPKHVPPSSIPVAANANPIVEFKHLHAFEGEGQIASMWDRRFNYGHVLEQLYFCGDQEKLCRAGFKEVGRFVKNNALRIASSAEFLVQQVEMLRKDVNDRVEENHMLQCKASQLASEVLEEKIARHKAESQLTKCEGEVVKNRKESKLTEHRLVQEWKKSVIESFQNALDQVRLGFPYLKLNSITLDPFKVVEGERLVDR